MTKKFILYIALHGVATQRTDHPSGEDEISFSILPVNRPNVQTFRCEYECDLCPPPDGAHDSGLLPELFLRMYEKFCQMDRQTLNQLERILLNGEGITRSDRSFPKWLERAKLMLEERFAEPNKLSEIAAEVGVHPVHLAREFRRSYGSTVGEYLRKLRIEYACRQLMITDHSPARIATAAGFADQSHFARTFKRMQGTTPGKYRAALKAITSLSTSSVEEMLPSN